MTEDQVLKLQADITALVNATTDAVEAEPGPEASDLYGNVYAENDAVWI